MRAKSFILFLIVFLTYAVDIYGFANRFTLSGTRMPLRQLFSTIENQSDYMFFYVDSDINGIDVSVKVNDTPVETVLDLALAETDLVYEIKDRYITILSKKDEGGGKFGSGNGPTT